MCFSSGASAVSLLFGMIGSALCVSLGTPSDKIIGFFFAFVSLMQLVDYLLWNHQKCDTYNKVVSIIGMILNHAQPIVLGILILIFNSRIPNKNLIYGILAVYSACIIPYSLEYLVKPNICTLKNPATSHLLWKWNYSKYYTFVYNIFMWSETLLLYFAFPDKTIAYFLILFGYLSRQITIWMYSRDIGALWCYFVVFYPIVYYLIRMQTNK